MMSKLVQEAKVRHIISPKPFHLDVFRFLPEQGSLLDVGIERGMMGALCRIYRPEIHLTAVEGWQPYLDFAMKHDFYHDYIEWDFSDGELPLHQMRSRYDVALALEVIEHLEKQAAFRLIEGLKRIANRVVISTPNGWQPQEDLDGNHYQNHKSAWSISELKGMGFKVRGVSGLLLPKHERWDFAFLLRGFAWLMPSFSHGLLGFWQRKD